MRWIVRIFYAVITEHEREVRSRQEGKIERRTPETMIHTKRLSLALVWIKDLWTEGGKTLMRRYYIISPKRDMMIVTDASP